MALSHFLASERRGSNTTGRLTAARGTFRVQLPVLWCKDGGWIHMKHLRESRINTAASSETQLPLMAKAKLTNRENSVWKQEKWVRKDQSTHSPRKQSSEERQTEALQPVGQASALQLWWRAPARGPGVRLFPAPAF